MAAVVDPSAIVAALLDEPPAAAIRSVLARESGHLIAAASLLELSIVVESRLGRDGGDLVESFVSAAQIEIRPVTAEHVVRALNGWRRFGKGRHRAALNYGDCFTYALADEAGLPILCIGDDFARTDLPVVALDPAEIA